VGKLPWADAFRLATDVLDTLVPFHEQRIVHRDLKPGNIFLTEEGQVKLLDFGVAQLREIGAETTRAGTAFGTPSFMAPEQVEDEGISPATDLYALASVVWEALTGLRLVKAETVGAIFHEILTATPPPPSLFRPGLPPEVDGLVLAALEKDPSRRPPDAETWGSRLAEALSSVPPAEPGWREAGESRPAVGLDSLPPTAPGWRRPTEGEDS
jgi:serine/threonine protein kinase